MEEKEPPARIRMARFGSDWVPYTAPYSRLAVPDSPGIGFTGGGCHLPSSTDSLGQ
jgi:hypothetical protein